MTLDTLILLAPALLILLALIVSRHTKKHLARHENWEMFHPPAEEETERAERIRAAGFNSLEELNFLCQKLHALRYKNILRAQGNNARPGLFPYRTLVRVYLQGSPKEEVIPERLGSVRVEIPPPLLCFFTFIDPSDIGPYRQLTRVYFSKLLPVDRANILRALFANELLDFITKYLNSVLELESLRLYLSGPGNGG